MPDADYAILVIDRLSDRGVDVQLIYQVSSNTVRAVLATNTSGRDMRFSVITPTAEEYVIIPDGSVNATLGLTGTIQVARGMGCQVRVA